MLKAIETQYNGYRFRSRLEARWAVFFDTLGVRYEYEPEGFDLNGLWYLPDFWLPIQRCWLEIKPEPPSGIDAEKVMRFAGSLMGGYDPRSDDPVPDIPQFVVLVGTPGLSKHQGGTAPDLHEQHTPYWDNYMEWSRCPVCGFYGVAYCGWAARLSCDCVPDGSRWQKSGGEDESLLAAYAAARAARFEHR